jgi:hypothetical protein
MSPVPAAPADGAERGRDLPAGIGTRQADRPLADVEGDETRPPAPVLEIDERLDVV